MALLSRGACHIWQWESCWCQYPTLHRTASWQRKLMPVATAQAEEQHAWELNCKSQPGGECLVVLQLSSNRPANQGTSRISLDPCCYLPGITVFCLGTQEHRSPS